jgi:hypothetical protein
LLSSQTACNKVEKQLLGYLLLGIMLSADILYTVLLLVSVLRCNLLFNLRHQGQISWNVCP